MFLYFFGQCHILLFLDHVCLELYQADGTGTDLVLLNRYCLFSFLYQCQFIMVLGPDINQ